MRKLILFFLLVGSACAQTFSGRAGDTVRVVPPFKWCLGEDNGKDACFIQTDNQSARMTNYLDFAWTPTTIGKLPTASSVPGRTYRVTDGQSSGDCTVGGGSFSTICTSDGSAWGGIGSSVFQGNFSSASFSALDNTITMLPQSPNAIYQGASNGIPDQYAFWTDSNGTDWPTFCPSQSQSCFFLLPMKFQFSGFADGQILGYNLAAGKFQPPLNVFITDNTVTAPVGIFAKLKTAAACAAVGSSANPSIVSCGAAAAGMFSCATTASTGTCKVNTSAATTNSTITITPSAADGTALGVTCNTTADSPTGPRLAAKVDGTSFTINLGTVAVNPTCYEYTITSN